VFSLNEETSTAQILLATIKLIVNSRNGTQYLKPAVAEVYVTLLCQIEEDVFERLYNL